MIWAFAPSSVQFGELKAVRKEAERLRSLSCSRIPRMREEKVFVIEQLLSNWMCD